MQKGSVPAIATNGFVTRALALAAGFTFSACGGFAGAEEDVARNTEALCSGASLASFAASSSAPTGTQVTWTASAGCAGGETPLYQFWVQDTGGTWSVGQAYSPQSSFSWNTTSLPAGMYNFQVWIKASGSSAAYETWTGRGFTLTSPSSCGAVTFQTTPSGSTNVGTQVTLSAAATCGGTAEYQFWAQDPSGNWSIARDWNAASQFIWSTTAKTAGKYHFQVWARTQGNPVLYEVYTGGMLDLTPAPSPCTTVSVQSSPTWNSGVTAGDPVLFTASAQCSGNAEYQYWVQSPDGAWSIAQPYGSAWGKYFSWQTRGLRAGDYQLQIWVRNQGSASTYDAYTGTGFKVSRPTFADIALGHLRENVFAPGTSVMLHAERLQGTPEYEWSVQGNGAPSPTVICPYSVSPDCTWNVSAQASGTYQVFVNARTAGYSTVEDTDTFAALIGDPAANCSNLSTVAENNAILPGGHDVITASTTCSGNFEYRYSYVPASGPGEVLRDWSSTPSYEFVAISSATGTQTVRVELRPTGSSSTLLSSDVPINILAQGNCTQGPSVSVSEAPIGATRTVRAVAPFYAEYEFWVQPPGGNYQLLRGYGGPTVDWDTTGAIPGDYWFQVWIRTPGDSSAYQAYASVRVTLTTSGRYVFGNGTGYGGGLAAGPHASIYAGMNGATRIDASGQVSTVSVQTNGLELNDIAVDANGSIWRASGSDSGSYRLAYKLVNVRPDGWFWGYAPATSPTSQFMVRELLNVGNDIWFTVSNRIGRFNAANRVITEYQVPASLAGISVNIGTYATTNLAVGPDSALWLSSPSDNVLVRFSESSGYTVYAVPTAASGVTGIAAGPDGNLWFTEAKVGKIGKLTPAGAFTEYAVGSNWVPTAIVGSPNTGNLFFAFDTQVYATTTSGSMSLAKTLQFPVRDLIAASNGAVWGSATHDANLIDTMIVERVSP